MRPLARAHRRESTEAEERLWQQLRGRKLDGIRFRRQHAVGSYIVDFYCSKERLVIEVDGPIHGFSKAKDAAREDFMRAEGLTVLRFRNDRVLSNLEGVLAEIRKSLQKPHPRPPGTPSPPGGEGAGG